MAGTALSVVLARIRKIIPEATSVDWTDADLVDDCLQPEYVEWAAALGHLPGPGWFTIVADFTLAANATTYNLTSLISSINGYFAALKSCWYLPDSGQPIPIDSCSPGQEEQWRLPIGQSPVGQQAPDRKWLTRPAGVPTLNLHPESNVARNFRVYLRYQPPTLDADDGAALLQTDPRHDRVLVRGAALRAMEDVGETDDVMERRYERDKSKFLDDERLAAGEFESETTKMTDVGEAMFGS